MESDLPSTDKIWLCKILSQRPKFKENTQNLVHDISCLVIDEWFWTMVVPRFQSMYQRKRFTPLSRWVCQDKVFNSSVLVVKTKLVFGPYHGMVPRQKILNFYFYISNVPYVSCHDTRVSCLLQIELLINFLFVRCLLYINLQYIDLLCLNLLHYILSELSTFYLNQCPW